MYRRIVNRQQAMICTHQGSLVIFKSASTTKIVFFDAGSDDLAALEIVRTASIVCIRPPLESSGAFRLARKEIL
jgi:hypothetical protein